jgi:hypothetical protein
MKAAGLDLIKLKNTAKVFTRHIYFALIYTVNQYLNNNYPVILTPEMKGAHNTGLDLIKLNNTTKFSHTILFLHYI